MFDTIGTYHQSNQVYNSLRYLADIKENIDGKSGEVTSYGKLKNLRVKVRGDFISINGSLPKYLFDDNVQELTRKHTQEAIESLSDSLHLEMGNSKPYRIDIASNFIMKEPLQKYYTALESLPRYEKKTYRDGLLFTTNNIALEFYDKNKELKKKKMVIPEIFENKNVLRYEVHLQKRLPKIFNQDVLAKNLYEEKFYMKAVDIWKDKYFSINKSTIVSINLKVRDMYNIAQLKNVSLYQYIIREFGTTESYLDFLHSEQKKGIVTKQFISGIKKQIKSWSALPQFHIEDKEAIKELDKKIIQRAKYYR